ncbi:hypothetical protein [Streptomyces sp. HPF1205]|uniref:hypothetical protein n=1 Tax=Streptomyces sp. HPF1205 TaxID=2873262 RepID=UPI001CEC7024|nr:hypothetical protein [Streptomyces sp. HPF1205]
MAAASSRAGIAAAALLATSISVLAGCANGANTTTGTTSAHVTESTAAAPPPTVAAVPTDVPASALHLPIEAYMLTPLQGARLGWEQDRALRACMARFGLDYPDAGPPPSGPDAGQEFAVMNRRYGVSAPSAAAVWGYHLARSAPSPASSRVLAPLTDAQSTVFGGTDPRTGKPVTRFHGKPLPAGGCSAESADLFPDVASPQGPGTAPGQTVATIKSDSFAASAADPRVTRVFAAWNSCMRGHGYHLPADPLKAPAGLRTLHDARPDRAEIAQAVADVACKQRTGLVQVWFAVESAYQVRDIARHRADLEKVKRERDATAAAVQAHLAG